MKRNKLVLAALLAAVLSLGVSPAMALQQSQIVALKKTVAEIPNLELAPKAAGLVLKASAKDREETATVVVRTIVSKKPSMVIAVVESIATVAPETAPAVAAVAAELCPGRAAEIAKVATAAAPDQARHIAARVAERAPKSAREITRSVVASAPIEAPGVMESVMAAVPAAKAQLESDLTLNLISTLARNSRVSAAVSFGKKIGSKPLKTPFTTPPSLVITPTNFTARSSAVDNAIKVFTTPSLDLSLSVKLQSDITISVINTLNKIGRESEISKTDRDAIINSTVQSVQTILANKTVSADDRTDIVKTTANIVSSIVSDPGLDDSSKKSFVTFTTDSIKTIVADTTIKKDSVDNAVADVAGEVQKVIVAVQNQTPEQAQAGLTKAQTNIDAIKKQYGSP